MQKSPASPSRPPPARPHRFQRGDKVEQDGYCYIVVTVSDPFTYWNQAKVQVWPVSPQSPLLAGEWYRQSLFRWMRMTSLTPFL
jgi:hypothetical protein